MILFRNAAYWPMITVALVSLLFIWAYNYSKKASFLFWGSQILGINDHKQRIKHALWIKMICSFIIIISITLSLMRPSGNPQIQTINRSGRDVVILLDVSKSMDAADIYPSRLERAKWEIAETLNVMEGDRVGLMVFAGNSVLKCPLTTDHGFLKMALEEVNTSSVSLGGTQMGDALRDVKKNLLDPSSSKEQDILLITDGEDHESFPVEAARALGEKGVRLLIVGLGSSNGEPVPLKDGEIMEYKGERVISRLDSATLREMASQTPGGKYLDVGTDSFELASIYKALISSADKGDGQEESRYIYDEFYGWFLLPGLIAFVVLFGYHLKKRGAL